MSTQTDINNVLFDTTQSTLTLEKLDLNNLSKDIVDMTLSLPTRIEAINLYYQHDGRDNTIETINKLGMMYELSGVKSLRSYLFAICEKSKIEPFLKSIAAKALWSYNNKESLAYDALNMIYPQLDDNVGTPYRIELIKMLMNSLEYERNASDYFCVIINDLKIDCQYRYKAILGLEHRPAPEPANATEEQKEEWKEWKEKSLTDNERTKRMLVFIKDACVVFINNKNNSCRFRILAGQNLLQKCVLTENERNQTEKALLEIAQNEKEEYNARADATDVLLSLGSGNIKQIAQQIITTLGIGTKKFHTVYDNAQNVHTQQVDESIQTTIEFLQGFEIMKINKDSPITFEYVQSKIMEFVKEEKKEDHTATIELALARIGMDRALYSKYNCSLVNILLKIWTYLSGHESEREMKKRLLEELIEMALTCSSGYASRLINVISGFGDFGIRISWREQIIANLNGRLNARIRNLDNLRMQERILNEMILETGDYTARKHFLRFLRDNLSSIREEMYEEFKNHMRDVDFDLYFRSAMAMYESGDRE